MEVTKEQVAELHAYLEDQGIEIVAADGRPAVAASGRFEPENGRAGKDARTRRASRRST